MSSAPTNLDARSLGLRNKMLHTMAASRRGHLASAFSVTEILRVLYDDVLRFDPKNPNWTSRDRCILSKGHGCMAMYVMLADKGFFPDAELAEFCQSDGMLGGHPDHKVPGIEASTGSLGHGLSIGIGMAINARFERSDSRVFVILGDGESNEGSVWEAALCAGKHQLTNLVVLVDYNKYQSYGSTYEIQDLEPLGDKWRAFGFTAIEVDGHDVTALQSALLNLPNDSGKPTAIICHTIKGKGAGFIENDMEWHHKNRISDDELQALHAALEAK